MKAKSGKVILSAVLVALIVGTASAQNSPSLEDTLKWLKDFLPNATGATSSGYVGMRVVRVTTTLRAVGGCKINLATEWVDLNTGERQDPPESCEFSLEDIDASTVKVETVPGTGIDVSMDARRKSMKCAGRPRDVAAQGVFLFKSREDAERVAKAFRHAAELCGKAEPF